MRARRVARCLYGDGECDVEGCTSVAGGRVHGWWYVASGWLAGVVERKLADAGSGLQVLGRRGKDRVSRGESEWIEVDRSELKSGDKRMVVVWTGRAHALFTRAGRGDALLGCYVSEVVASLRLSLVSHNRASARTASLPTSFARLHKGRLDFPSADRPSAPLIAI